VLHRPAQVRAGVGRRRSSTAVRPERNEVGIAFLATRTLTNTFFGRGRRTVWNPRVNRRGANRLGGCPLRASRSRCPDRSNAGGKPNASRASRHAQPIAMRCKSTGRSHPPRSEHDDRADGTMRRRHLRPTSADDHRGRYMRRCSRAQKMIQVCALRGQRGR
jgi:hypothetical protein